MRFVDKCALGLTNSNGRLQVVCCSLLLVVHLQSLLGVLIFFPAICLLLSICVVITQSIVSSILFCCVFFLLLSLFLTFRVQFCKVCVLVLKNTLAVLTEVERDLCKALACVSQVEVSLVEDALTLANVDGLFKVELRESKQLSQLLFDLPTEVGQLNQVFTQSEGVKWDVISQAVFVLLDALVLALELDNLVDEDFLVGKTQ